MADRVTKACQVCLNNVIFPIEGNVREQLISRFPAKIITGEYDYANEQILSNFIINDQRGGLLIEEMDEAIHADRYWYSTCDMRFKNNTTLPPLATLATAPTADTPTIVNADMELTTGWTGGARSSDENYTSGGTYSWKLTTNVNTVTATQNLTGYKVGARYTFTCWIKNSASTNSAKLGINDGVTTTYGSASTSTSWTQLTVTATLGTGATTCQLILSATNSVGSASSYFDDAAIALATSAGTVAVFANFNSQLYCAYGTWFSKLNAGATGFDLIYTTSATITDLVLSSDGYLLIFCGDSTNYFYLNTSDAVAQANVANADIGIRWDGKSWKMNTSGQWWYSTDAGSATPTWTAADATSGLDDYNQTPQSLELHRDAAGDVIIYCATAEGKAFAYDFTNTKWVETELGMPSHPTCGLGLIEWHASLYMSGGLSVKKYTAGATATLLKMGLDQDDGLPALRNGEIVKFIKGDDEFFTLIDSTYEGTTSRSQVVSYDGRGWRVWWEATADNKNMYSGIVSSDTAYRLWFSTTDGVYYITLQRTSRNPLKVSGYTFGSAGVHISPRFDAGTKAFPKLATKLTLFLDGMSANETVTVTYQIDQAQGALGSGWTALGSAQVADGIATLPFGTSGVGIEFYDIQFRSALARGGTNTNTPVIKGMTLSYLKLLGKKKAWNFTINTGEAQLVGATPKELYDAIATIIGTDTLMPFTFRDGSVSTDTHYVLLHPFYGSTPSGTNWEGKWDLTVIEV